MHPGASLFAASVGFLALRENLQQTALTFVNKRQTIAPLDYFKWLSKS
jgi:hypothetical protein